MDASAAAGLSTHVTLCDLEKHRPEAVGHGADEAETVLDLWTTLKEHPDTADAVAYVVEAYRRRTGRAPEPPPRPVQGH